jgi:hypothetical protein
LIVIKINNKPVSAGFFLPDIRLHLDASSGFYTMR